MAVQPFCCIEPTTVFLLLFYNSLPGRTYSYPCDVVKIFLAFAVIGDFFRSLSLGFAPDKGDGVVVFVAQAQMDLRDAARGLHRLYDNSRREGGSAEGALAQADGGHDQWRSQSCSKGFAERFFCSPAQRKVARWVFLRGQLCQFVRVQNFFGEALAVFLVKRGDAAFVDDVGSDHFCDVNVKKAGLARVFAVAGTSGFIQPECFVQGAHGEFEVFFVYAHGDFDFRGANDVDVDAFFCECLEHGAGDCRV